MVSVRPRADAPDGQAVLSSATMPSQRGHMLPDTLGGMPPRLNLFTNRERANSFGGAAHNYDTHRPRYPDQLIDDVLAPGVRRVLEAGAGTGIASTQFIERGAELLAVEPDTRMAAVAQAKGIPVEIATFEQWEPAGRRFDRVVFAASFHWVDPAVALPKVRGILDDGGQLALIWNRLDPPDLPVRSSNRSTGTT